MAGIETIKSTSIPPIPGPPEEQSAREIIVRGLSAHKLRRLETLVAAGVNTGDIAVQLSIQSSVVVMYTEHREQFDAIRSNADPRNLGGGPVSLPDAGGRSYRNFPGPLG